MARAKKVKLTKAQEKALLATAEKAAKQGSLNDINAKGVKRAPKGSRSWSGSKVQMSLTERQTEQRQKYLSYDAVKIEDVIFKARAKNVKEWLRAKGVKPTLRQDWYWIYTDKWAPEKVESFLYSRGFRRHSQKPAYVFSGTCAVKGYGDETRYGGESRF